MIKLLALAMCLFTTSLARAAVINEAPAPAHLNAATVPAGCPYHFGNDMPAATFCVYRGTARDGRGEVCATDVIVIWSSYAPQAAITGRLGEGSTRRAIYVGFVAAPELVVRAVVDPGHRKRAEMVGYSLGMAESARPSEQTTRGVVRLDSPDLLSMDVQAPHGFKPGRCAFASYSGTFLGLVRPSR